MEFPNLNFQKVDETYLKINENIFNDPRLAKGCSPDLSDSSMSFLSSDNEKKAKNKIRKLIKTKKLIKTFLKPITTIRRERKNRFDSMDITIQKEEAEMEKLIFSAKIAFECDATSRDNQKIEQESSLNLKARSNSTFE